MSQILRQPLPPEELKLSRSRGDFIISGPTFTYRVQAATGLISGIRVARGGTEVISNSGPAEILMDDLRFSRHAASCHVSVLSNSADQVVLRANGLLARTTDPAHTVSFTLLHRFYNDGVLVSEVKLTPHSDFAVTNALLWQVPVTGNFQTYLHKRLDENGSTSAHGALPATGSLRFTNLTSCLGVASPQCAFAIFTDSGALQSARPRLATAVAEIRPQNQGVTLSQYLVHVSPSGEAYRLKAGTEFSFRVGLSLAPNRVEHPRTHDLRMFIWIGDANYPYPTDQEITDVAHWGYTLFQMHRVGTPGEPRPPAGELQRVIRKVHELGMLFLWEENADLMYESAPGIQAMKTRGKWNLWQGFNYGGRYQAAMDSYCDLAATCLASPNGLAEYRLANLNRMLDRFAVDGVYLDDNLAYANCPLWKEHHHPSEIYDSLIELHEMNWRRRNLLRRRIPHAVLISHNTRAFVLPILADFDVQYFAEGYCFDSAEDYWNNYRTWSLAFGAQAMICPGDDEGAHCQASVAFNCDFLTGGGQFNEMDWRLFANKFNYVGAVPANELQYCKTYNLAQYYFGLSSAKAFYFADSTNLFRTTVPSSYATIYQNRGSKSWLIALANMRPTAQVTSLNFQLPEALGFLPGGHYLRFDVHQRAVASFAGRDINQAFQEIKVPGQNLQLYEVRECPLNEPCHLWGGQRMTEKWEKRRGKLTVELQGPLGLRETIFLSPSSQGIRQVTVGGKPANFSWDARRGVVHGLVTFTAQPLKIEMDCAKAFDPLFPIAEAEPDPIGSIFR